MMVFLLRISPPAHQRREVIEILRCLEGPVSAKPGCLACQIFEGAAEDPSVLYLERWESETALQRHIQSPMFSKIIAAIDMSESRPDIQFIDVSRTRGLDMIEALRRQPEYH